MDEAQRANDAEAEASKLPPNGSSASIEGASNNHHDSDAVPPPSEATSESNDSRAAAAARAETAEQAANEADQKNKCENDFMRVLDDIISGLIPSAATGVVAAAAATVGKNGKPPAVARLINLSRKLADSETSYASYRQAYFAAKLLRSSPGSSSLVDTVIDDIEFAASKNSPIYTVMGGLVTSVAYLLCGGAALLALFVLPFAASAVSEIAGASQSSIDIRELAFRFLDMALSPFPVAMLFGMLGSVVSILLRLSEFETATRKSRQFLRMTGAMLPLVGAVFAAVTCALFVSGIINFQFATGAGGGDVGISTPYFYVVVGFLSGFSERFTRGLLGTAEERLAGTEKPAGGPATPGTAQ